MAVSAGQLESKVAVVVVTYNALEFVRICLDSVERYSTMPYELIVVDNASDSATVEHLKGRKNIKLILNDENKLWCEGCNVGIRAISDDVTHICLLNSDMEVRRADWLQRMVNVSNSSDRIGMVGTTGNRVRVWPTFGGVDGQCWMLKRSLMDDLGLLDSERFPWNGVEIDYAARAFAKGYIYKIMPSVPELVVHYHGMSRRKRKGGANKVRLHKDADVMGIMRGAGLKPWPMPRWLWQLYKRLPGRPFYELTHEEAKLARGSIISHRKRYGQKLVD